MLSLPPRKLLSPRAVPLAALLASASALAFVLPGGAILRRMVAAHANEHLTNLRVEGTASFYGEALKEAAQGLQLPLDKPEGQADAVLMIRFPGRCRLDLTTPEGGRMSLVEANGRRRSDGGNVLPLTVALSQVCRLLAPRGAGELETRGETDRYLRSLGIKTELTSLEKQGDQVAFVLGKPGAKEPQFWVFKDSFLPARIRLVDEAKTPWEVRFVDYNSPSAGETFPRVVEVLKNGERILRFTVLKADTRVNLSDKLFAGV